MQTDDKRLQEEVSVWMVEFMKDHFPVGMNPKIDSIIREVIVHAFIDGVEYGQEVVKRERLIATPTQAEKNKIQIAKR